MTDEELIKYIYEIKNNLPLMKQSDVNNAMFEILVEILNRLPAKIDYPIGKIGKDA